MKKELQSELAKRLLKENLISDKMAKSIMNGRGNKGILKESIVKLALGIEDTFDNHQGADFEYNGDKIQFKYVGCGSRPSATETKKIPGETEQAFVDRIVYTKYSEVTKFWIDFGELDKCNINDIVVLTPLQFKEFLLDQNIKNNKKIRISKKSSLNKYRY